MEIVKDRLKAFITYLNLTNQRFEIECGLSNGYISNMRKGVGEDALERISNTYPQLSRSWLLTGEGDMLKSTSNTDTNSKEDPMTIEMLTRMLYDFNTKIKELERKVNELEAENYELKYGSAKKESHVG